MSKIRVAIVRGGPSDEHDVSLSSARSVVKNIDHNKYELIDVFVSREGQWSINDATPTDDDTAIGTLKEWKVDVVFLAVHGTYGEDGALQQKLENADLAYTGSDATASALAFDKTKAEAVYKQHNLPVPASQTITSSDTELQIDAPLVVKPASQGSSVGVTVVQDVANVQTAIDKAFQHDTKVLVQEFISGREVSCGVLEKDGVLLALPPTELIPKTAEFYDYDAKYVAGATDEITPPDMSEEVIGQIQHYAKQAHEALGCTSYSRTDMFVTDNGIYMIETNTLPGMTPTSLLPQQAEVQGISFSELIDIIITNAKARV